MTSPTDERLRTLLRDIADDMPSMPLLERLEPAPVPLLERRRTILTMVAVAAAVVLLLAGVLVVRDTREPQFVDPVISPPRIFHLGAEMTERPGTVRVAVLMARVPDDEDRNAQVLPAAGGTRVLETSDTVPAAWYQSLSWDGTHLVRQHDSAGTTRLEVVDLRTGTTNSLGGRYGFCPQLSPDNRTVAVFSSTSDGLELVDVNSGRLVGIPERTRTMSFDPCTALGWSPTGELLVVGGPAGSVVLDSDERVVDRMPQSSAVNGNQSWSPDGESLLTYDREDRRFGIRDVRTGETSVLPPPGPDAVRPLGWAGDRVVWLVGPVGDQQLATTDTEGGDRQLWMRLELEGRPIDTVQWSWALSGRPLPSAD